MHLCCFFNYAPLYREDIYRRIDQTFDTQFYFGEEVIDGQKSGIAKIDYSIFKKPPRIFRNLIILKRFSWRTKIWSLPFRSYDTYLITGDFVYSYIPFLLLCKLFRKRVYGWGHGIKGRNGWARFLNDFLYRTLTGFFSYGQGGKRRLEELGYDRNRIFVIYNSLVSHCSREDLKSEIFKSHFGNTYPTLVFVGRLTAQKKLEWTLKAIYRLNIEYKPCNLIIVGTGSVETELKRIAREYNIEDKVWFYGECYDESKNSEILYNSDICISPGNVGLTALHALQFGTPVISHSNFDTQGPEYEAIRPYKTGLLYERNNFEDFYAKIREWIEFAKGRREEIRQYCYAMIDEKWNSVNQIEILKDVLLKSE